VKIGLVLENRNPVTNRVLDLLRERGATLEVLEPSTYTFDLGQLRLRSDIYILKSVSSPMGFSIASALHARGAVTRNPFPVCMLLRNKITAMTVLADHGVPIPRTYAAVDRHAHAPLLAEGPLVIKPYNGSRGVGVHIVHTREELDALDLSSHGHIVFAQRYHPSDDQLDHKISVIDDRVFGVKRIFPIARYDDKLGVPFEPSEEVREIARRIANALGITLFSFDVVMSANRPYVVDVGMFGSFMGVAGASELITDWIIRAWEER
jgi:ribosomal protein S6--L-glutamate ligase